MIASILHIIKIDEFSIKTTLFIAFFIFICNGALSQENNKIYTWNFHTTADTTGIKQLINDAEKIKVYSVDSAIPLLQQALRESEEINYSDGIKTSVLKLNNIYIAKGWHEKSMIMLREALMVCSRSPKLIHTLPQIYNSLAVVCKYNGEYELAAQYFYLAIWIIEKIELRNPVRIYNNLSVVLTPLKQYRQASYYLDKAEKEAVAKKDYEVLGTVFINRGNICAAQGKWDDAVTYYKSSIKIAQTYYYAEMEEEAESNLAGGYVDHDMPSKALPYLLQAQSLKGDASAYYQGFTAEKLGIAYSKLHSYKKAIHFALKSLEVAQPSGFRELLVADHQLLAVAYEKTGNYKLADDHRKVYEDLKDSLDSKDITQNISQLDVKYRTAEKDKDILEKQLLITRQEDQLKKEHVWIGGISAGLLFICILSVSLYRHNRNKQKLQANQIHILKQQKEIDRLKAEMEGEETERKRIARELHDGIMVKFSAVKMNLSILPNRHSTLVESKTFGNVVSQLDDAIRELRETAHNLMPDMLLEKGLVEAVQFFCSSLKVETLDITFLRYGDFPRLNPDFDLSVYRMIQELVQNIVKHAHAKSAIVQLSCKNELLCLTIEDDGVGIAPSAMNKSNGMGLRAIQNRVAMMNGHIDINSSESGTIVYIEFDIQDTINKKAVDAWA